MRTSSSAGFDLWEAVDGLREAFAPRVSGRMGRGDIRTAILVALTEEPMHGYQIIQSIEKSTRGAWKPSPGSIYPTLQLLADEGLVTSEQVGVAVPKAGAKLAQAIAQVAQGTPEQTERAVEVIDEARRKIYAILAED